MSTIFDTGPGGNYLPNALLRLGVGIKKGQLAGQQAAQIESDRVDARKTQASYRQSQLDARNDTLKAQQRNNYERQISNLQAAYGNGVLDNNGVRNRARAIAASYGVDPSEAENDVMAWLSPDSPTAAPGAPQADATGQPAPAPAPSAQPPLAASLRSIMEGPPPAAPQPPADPLASALGSILPPSASPYATARQASVALPAGGRTRYAPTGPRVSPFAPLGNGMSDRDAILARIAQDEAELNRPGRSPQYKSQFRQDEDSLYARLGQMNQQNLGGIDRWAQLYKDFQTQGGDPEAFLNTTNSFRRAGVDVSIPDAGMRPYNGGMDPAAFAAKVAATPPDQRDKVMINGRPMSSYLDANGNVLQIPGSAMTQIGAQRLANMRTADDYKQAMLQYLQTTRTQLGKAQIDAIRQGRIPLDQATIEYIRNGRMPEAVARIANLNANTDYTRSGKGAGLATSDKFKSYFLPRTVMTPMGPVQQDPLLNEAADGSVTMIDPKAPGAQHAYNEVIAAQRAAAARPQPPPSGGGKNIVSTWRTNQGTLTRDAAGNYFLNGKPYKKH